MTPLNQPERRTRIWQFGLLYLLALLVPLAASYYLFSNNSLADENAQLKKELDTARQEQQLLVTRFDTLNQQMLRIDAVDSRLRGEKDPVVQGRLRTQSQDYLTDVATSLSQLRADSARLQVPAHRLLVRDELRFFDQFRATRSSINTLQEQLVSSGKNGDEILRLTHELDNCRQQLALVGAMRPPAQAPSGGGGGGAAPAAVSPSARQQIALLQDKIAFANADCLRQRALDHKPRSKERRQMLEQARTSLIQVMQASTNPEFKQSVERILEPINTELGRPPRLFDLF